MSKGKQDKFKLRGDASYKRESKGLETRQGRKEHLIVLSFKDFDRNQGQSFEEWEEDKLLALAVSKLREVCQLTKAQAIANQIIKPYSKIDFPPESIFEHPKHVLPDVTWCSMHIKGKECVIGYFIDNVFQVVFLDKNHEFWITQKKNT